MKKIILMILLFVLTLPVFAEYAEDDLNTVRQIELEEGINEVLAEHNAIYGTNIYFDCEIYYSSETLNMTIIDFYSQDFKTFTEQCVIFINIIMDMCATNNILPHSMGILGISYVWLPTDVNNFIESEDKYDFSVYSNMWECWFSNKDLNFLLTIEPNEREVTVRMYIYYLYEQDQILLEELIQSSISFTIPIMER